MLGGLVFSSDNSVCGVKRLSTDWDEEKSGPHTIVATWKLESPGDSFFIQEILLLVKILLLTRNPFIKVTLVMLVGDVGNY